MNFPVFHDSLYKSLRSEGGKIEIARIHDPKLIQLTSFQLIALLYISAVTIATILFSLPIARQPGVEWSLIDVVFTAVSAVSVTGLTVVSIADTFSVFGTFILLFVIQIGGIGLMTLSTFIWLFLGRKIGLRERQLMRIDQNQLNLAGLVQLMKQIMFLVIAIEIIGTLILGTYFLRIYPTWQTAYYQAFFAAISATTNTGFDITGASLLPYANDYFVQTIHMILIISGAIGFPVLIEVKHFIQTRKKQRFPYRFSLFTKLTTTTYFILIIAGFFLLFMFEFQHYFVQKTWHESMFYSIFQSVTTRSSGLTTLDVNELSLPSLLLLSFLMFIGASPSSVGGGIRTTTFAILLLAIYFFAKGKRTIKVFHREIYDEDVMKAYVVAGVAILLISVSTMILSVTEPFPLHAIIFEVTSAFGTAGLSVGITSELSTIGKIVLMILMFIGRIGLVTLIFLIRGHEITETIHYPKEHVIIG